MPEVIKDPSRALLLGGVIAAGILAALGGFMFFANVPEPGAAREQVMAAATPMNRAEIDKLIAERQAMAPRPSAVARAERAADALSTRDEMADMPLEAMAAAAPEPMLAAKPSAQPEEDVTDQRMRIGTSAGLVSGTIAKTETYDAKPDAKRAPDAAKTSDGPSAARGEKQFRDGLYPEALATWKAAAEAGDRVAAYRVGIEYLDGKPGVVQRDLNEGAKWIRMAAEWNEPRAQFELGSLYENGNGMTANLAEAASWYLKAAERNHPQGQYNIATMLETGEGIAQDRIEALKFYTLAAANGFRGIPMDAEGRVDQNALDPLLNLRQSMPVPDVEEAEKRAAAFKPIVD
ncbi:hypothetical protein sos41_25180 [Alphaproteobacteria bacterium SO-S41]|nr:hypothetical protein sos41_25180 [Alphaproteobacteria bacterium SO-S41]